MIRTAAGAVLLTVGTVLIAVTALGLLRLPDVYNRMNAVAKSASLGLVCVLLGVLVLLPGIRNALVLGTAILFQLATAPVGGYTLARAAYRAGSPLAPLTRYDELASGRHRGPPGGGDAGSPSGGDAGPAPVRHQDPSDEAYRQP